MLEELLRSRPELLAAAERIAREQLIKTDVDGIAKEVGQSEEKATLSGPFQINSGGGIRTRNLRVMRRLLGVRYMRICRTFLILSEVV